MKHPKLVMLGIAVAAFGFGAVMVAPWLQSSVAAAGCDPPAIMFGRYRWCGYFYNRYEDSGDSVRLAGVPASVNNVNDFYNLIHNDYTSGNTQKITGAVFVVRTMIGAATPTPPCALGACKTLTAAQWAEFKDRLEGYASTSENGSTSTGASGHIDWFHKDYMHCGDYNSYYQNTYHDIAPFIINSTNTPDCNDSSIKYDHIFVYDKSGNVIFRIRRPCMNPLGTLKELAEAPPQYNLTSSITATSGGSPLTSGSYVQAGDPITFAYNVNNSMADTATGISCQAHANNKAGWVAVPSPETTGATPAGVTCKSSFTAGNNSLGAETIASAPNDTSICRSLIVSPKSPSGGQSAVEVCVYVSSRPYFRAYGGDISAGNAQSNACATVTKAGIVGWTKDLTSYSGASTQYAALALDSIYNFATNMGNAAGTATTPSGLAFASTTASGQKFGGNFGSLPCMADRYGTPSGTPFAGGNITSLATGTYTATGPITISGNVNPNNRIVLYVDGNVTINGNINYPGSWDVDSMPLFELIVRGNINIDKGVSKMDGVYIAQSSGAANTGIIYTCTNGATPYTVSAAGTFNNPCNDNTLVVNGAVIAKQIQLLRTKGTAKQSSASEASGNANQAEVFNYSPAVWMATPPNAPAAGKYDSITSLPPIL